MNYIPVKLKNTPLMFSAIVFTACLAMPLTSSADTDSSVDAIMEQLKSFKAPVPQVSKPSSTTVIKDSATPVEKPVEAVKIETAPVTETKSNVSNNEPPASGIYVTPESEPEPEKAVVKRKTKKVTRTEKKVRARSQQIASQKRSTRKAKKRINKRANKTINKRVNKIKPSTINEEFGPEYMALINDILNNKKPSKRPTTRATGSHSGGLSGWIFVGKYSAGQSKGVRTLKSGNQLPVVGQQYTVKSPLLNMRKTRPLSSGLGKLIKVLHVGDRVQIKSLHRSSKNNYWANIVRL